MGTKHLPLSFRNNAREQQPSRLFPPFLCYILDLIYSTDLPRPLNFYRPRRFHGKQLSRNDKNTQSGLWFFSYFMTFISVFSSFSSSFSLILLCLLLLAILYIFSLLHLTVQLLLHVEETACSCILMSKAVSPGKKQFHGRHICQNELRQTAGHLAYRNIPLQYNAIHFGTIILLLETLEYSSHY